MDETYDRVVGDFDEYVKMLLATPYPSVGTLFQAISECAVSTYMRAQQDKAERRIMEAVDES